MHHKVIIVGMGAAGLITAARLCELGITDIGIYAVGYGGTPFIAAINFILPQNRYNDTAQKYAEDMIEAGYNIMNKDIVKEMTENSENTFNLLRRCNVEFSKDENGEYILRHVSGHRYPRSLCSTKRLIGLEIKDKLKDKLVSEGVKFYEGYECVNILSDKLTAYGITVKTPKGKIENCYADVIVAAWGGIGNLFGKSTYPKDIQGNTLAIAKEAGAELIDVEFLEYEPMVITYPEGAVGEPCPTAMLGEGAHLLNSKGERFILNSRPSGEAGASKTFLNKEIWKQISEGNGTEHGGVYVDLRHIDEKVLRSYPWFYTRLSSNKINPKTDLIEVAPMAHSFSGGIKVNSNYESKVNGLFAVGEACGGIHGACRCAGNAASQAAISGYLCANAIFDSINTNLKNTKKHEKFEASYPKNDIIYNKYNKKLKDIAEKAMGIYRNRRDLEIAIATIKSMLSQKDILDDLRTVQIAKSMLYMLTAALERKESRGSHLREDYPQLNKEYEKEITI